MSDQGITREGHVWTLLGTSQSTLSQVIDRITSGKRITRAQREELWRELAGVVSACETVRLWLAAGAPR